MSYQYCEVEGFYPRRLNIVVGGENFDQYGCPYTPRYQPRDLYEELKSEKLKDELDSWIGGNDDRNAIDVEIEFWKYKIRNCKNKNLQVEKYERNLFCARRMRRNRKSSPQICKLEASWKAKENQRFLDNIKKDRERQRYLNQQRNQPRLKRYNETYVKFT